MLKIITAIIVLLYLVNCCTPLRLHVDMLRYFAIKDCIELGCPPDSDAAKDYMPVGYTALLLAFSKLGILKSYTIVLVNCIYLFAGLWLVIKMFRGTIHPYFFLALVLLNWTVIKFVTHPLSEMQYLFFSTASVFLFYRFTQDRRLWMLLGSFVMGGLAFLTRSVGIALFAALVTGLLWQYRKELILLVRKNKILVLLVVLAGIGVVVFSKTLGLNHYTGVFSKQKQEGLSFGVTLKGHFIEWTEIGANLSIAKVSNYLHAAPLLFTLVGIGLLVAFLFILLFRSPKVPFIVKAYLIWYSLLMFNWPFYDPRFWVPVLPLIAAVLAQYFGKVRTGQVSTARPGQGWLRMVVFSVYFLLGIASVGYLTYTSLNRKVFARTQANGVYRAEYETFFFGKPQEEGLRQADPNIVDILRRYDR